MKEIIALAITFCLVGGYGMATAAEYNGDRRPPSSNGNQRDHDSRRERNDNAVRPDSRHPESRPSDPVRGHKTGIYIGADTFGIFLDTQSRHQHRGNQDKMRRDAREDRFGDWYADPNRYHRFKRSSWHKRDCFPVSRHAYDQRGRRVTVGATMCYTRDGRTYIAEGSRRTYR